MKNWVKYQPLIILSAALLGLACSALPSISRGMTDLEDPLLMLLLFFIFLEVDTSDIKKAFTNIRFTGTALMINFLWTPLFAFLLARLFMPVSPELQTALMMLLVMPCTDWYIIFTEMTGGNVPLASSLLPFNLVLQLLLLPVYLKLFLGRSASFTIGSLLLESAEELLIPIVLALLVKHFVLNSEGYRRFTRIMEKMGDNAEFIIVCLIAFSIFAAQGQQLFKQPDIYPSMLGAMAVFYTVNFVLALFIGKTSHFSRRDIITLVFTATARNTPLSLSLAGLLFPDRPLIALALLIGPLTELPVSTFESFLLKRTLPQDAA